MALGNFHSYFNSEDGDVNGWTPPIESFPLNDAIDRNELLRSFGANEVK